MKTTHFEQLQEYAERSIGELLVRTAEIFGDRAAFSSSLGWEDQVITHFIFSQNLPIRVFTLDTGRLFPETYHVLNSTRKRYGKEIEVYFPESDRVEQLVTTKGPFSFYTSVEERKTCCLIRKVEPLNRALRNVDCWITGLRAEQSDNRQLLPVVTADEQRGIIKLNPLADWTLDDVRSAIRKYNIPYNVLHDRGFVSIGCQPCTRAVREGEDFRSGRWWWEDNSKKECGLHA